MLGALEASHIWVFDFWDIEAFKVLLALLAPSFLKGSAGTLIFHECKSNMLELVSFWETEEVVILRKEFVIGKDGEYSEGFGSSEEGDVFICSV